MCVVMAAAGCADDDGGSDGREEPKRPTVVALGDSIPLNDPTDCPGCVGFVESYADAVNADAINLARGGALTGAIAGEIQRGDAADELEDADLVIVSFGGNDQPPYRQEYQPCRVGDPETVVEAVEAVAATTTDCVDQVTRRLTRNATGALEAITEQAPDAAIAVLVPYNFWIGLPALEGAPDTARRAADRLMTYAVESWRDALCDVVAGVDGACIDVYAAFNGPDGRQPAGDLVGADHTHPSQQGNDLIRDLLLEANLLPTTGS
jgi:lysophospholipase L1-like esterase